MNKQRRNHLRTNAIFITIDSHISFLSNYRTGLCCDRPMYQGRILYVLSCGFFLFFFFFSSPNLSGRRLDVYHTSTHGVALVRIYNAGLKCAACCSLEMQDPKNRQNSPTGHHRTTSSGYIFATKACTIGKMLNSNISFTCLYNMVNFGLLVAEIVSLVWSTPANFNGFRVLAALLHDTLVVGVSQSAALNRGCHLYLAGRPSRWALAHLLVLF